MQEPTIEANGTSSALFESLRDSSSLSSQAAMAAYLQPKNCELLNRPGLGLSETASTLLCLHALLDQPDVVISWHSDWNAAVKEHHLIPALKVLNTSNASAHSEGETLEAAKRLVQWSTDSRIQALWPRLASLTQLGAGLFVGGVWATQSIAVLSRPQLIVDKLNCDGLDPAIVAKFKTNLTLGSLTTMLGHSVFQHAQGRASKGKKGAASASESVPMAAFTPIRGTMQPPDLLVFAGLISEADNLSSAAGAAACLQLKQQNALQADLEQ
jgi:hypothetical protein